MSSASSSLSGSFSAAPFAARMDPPPSLPASSKPQFPWKITGCWSSTLIFSSVAAAVSLTALAYFQGAMLFTAGFAFLTLGLLFGAYSYYNSLAFQRQLTHLLSENRSQKEALTSVQQSLEATEASKQALLKENGEKDTKISTLTAEALKLREQLDLARSEKTIREGLDEIGVRGNALATREIELGQKADDLDRREASVREKEAQAEAVRQLFDQAQVALSRSGTPQRPRARCPAPDLSHSTSVVRGGESDATSFSAPRPPPIPPLAPNLLSSLTSAPTTPTRNLDEKKE